MSLFRSAYWCSVLLLFPGLCRAAEFLHPLDALSADEYTVVLDAMKASGHLDSASRFAGVNLHEPPKQEVLRWKQGDPFRREALAIIKQGRKTFEALVDVANRKLISWTEIPGVEPMLITDESDGIDRQVKANPEVQAALRKRGITNIESVSCDGSSPGYFGTPEEQGRRLQRVICTYGHGHSNSGAYPIEG